MLSMNLNFKNIHVQLVLFGLCIFIVFTFLFLGFLEREDKNELLIVDYKQAPSVSHQIEEKIEDYILANQPIEPFARTNEVVQAMEGVYVPYENLGEFKSANPDCCLISNIGIDGFERSDGGLILVVAHKLRYRHNDGNIKEIDARVLQFFLN